MKKNVVASLVLLLTALVTLAPSGMAAGAGANYPSRPLRTLVGFPPGSGTDMLARFIGAQLTERVGQQVVVDNRPGANGIIAAELATKAAPDGHTLLYISVSHTMNAAVYQLPFDPVKSFTPVMRLGAGPLVLVANPAFPAATVKGLIKLAAAKPNAITYAISGTGGINHFAGAMFARMAGIQLINVPYKGGAQALTEIVGGQVQIMIGTLAITLPQVRAGRLKALGVSSVKRTAQLPGVPTIAESGMPGYEINTWWGILGPPGMPATVVEKLDSEIGSILRQPESAQRLEMEGAEPAALPSAAFSKLLISEIERWKRIARESNIRAE